MKVEELAKELMRFETTSPVTDERIFEFLKGVLEKEGISPKIVKYNDVTNLIADTGNPEGSRICLNGHLDVVEAEGEWSVTQPFKPVIKDGKLYGRGAADMKAALAAQIKAFVDLHNDDDFEGHATLMAVGDEEIGGFNGSKAIVEDYYERGKSFDYAIVGEATDLNIQVGTRGVLWVDIELKGDNIHATRTHLADKNTIEELPEAIDSINGLEMSYENNGSLPDPTIEVTNVYTGDTYNSLPGTINIGVDIRYVPSQSTESVKKDIESALEHLNVDTKVKINKDHGGAFELQDEEFRNVTSEVLKEIRGEKPQEITEGGASDGRFFSEHGTPFIELGVNQEKVHGEDEYCRVENLEKLRRAYYQISKDLAVTEKSDMKAEVEAE